MPGVRGALLISATDGLVVAEQLMDGIDGRAVAALAASLVQRLVRATAGGRAAESPPSCTCAAIRGSVLAAPGRNDLVLVAVAGPDANLGLARLEMLDAVGTPRLMRALEPWVEAPLQTFLTESSARLILLMTTSGQVVAQHGFARSLDVMTAAALGAGIVASTEELARIMGGVPLRGRWCITGTRQSCMLSAFGTPRGRWIGLVVFGPETSVGIGAAVLRPDGRGAGRRRRRGSSRAGPLLAENFEHELNASLKALFGR